MTILLYNLLYIYYNLPDFVISTILCLKSEVLSLAHQLKFPVSNILYLNDFSFLNFSVIACMFSSFKLTISTWVLLNLRLLFWILFQVFHISSSIQSPFLKNCCVVLGISFFPVFCVPVYMDVYISAVKFPPLWSTHWEKLFCLGGMCGIIWVVALTSFWFALSVSSLCLSATGTVYSRLWK